MREFYVFGFKSREEYSQKSARSYDDERRRMESWLGDYMRFTRTAEGKNTFLSIDSRSNAHNPFYRAWKAKSFTDLDITFHFILFDMLHDPDTSLSVSQITEKATLAYFFGFDKPPILDESTVRKKLKEYEKEGLLIGEKRGRRIFYRRAEDTALGRDLSFLDFYSEIAPCGVIGSFLLDKYPPHADVFSFKHHYITGALDSGVIADLFCAMREERIVTVSNLARHTDEPKRLRLIPLRIFISAQNGRQHLIAYQPEGNLFRALRIDYLSDVKAEEITPRFSELRAELDIIQKKMWGVTLPLKRNMKTECVEFTIKVESGEDYIPERLEREKRVGTVEKIGKDTYRFSAEVYDAGEMIPWIRSFICRITEIHFSNPRLETRFKKDLRDMYRMYETEEKT
ncbi:MAG: WYL domain-containing protein [Ruminococcaceae bacterium]|nr:WYL domain-containing protein [Oscillospiraceae bacterium]